MQEYKAALTQEERDRIDELMKQLKVMQDKEKVVTKELRRLIYKTESPR